MPTFPKQTLLAIATFAAILLAVHYGISNAKGMGLSTLRPITDFPSGRASLFPIIKSSSASNSRRPRHTGSHGPRPQGGRKLDPRNSIPLRRQRGSRPLLRCPARSKDRSVPPYRPHRPLRRLPHHRRPHHRRRPRHPAGALRQRRPRLHPHRQALGLVRSSWRRRLRRRLEDRHRRQLHARSQLRPWWRYLHRPRRCNHDHPSHRTRFHLHRSPISGGTWRRQHRRHCRRRTHGHSQHRRRHKKGRIRINPASARHPAGDNSASPATTSRSSVSSLLATPAA